MNSGQSAMKKVSAKKEMQYFESIIDFSIQCVYIVMHRRGFHTISKSNFETILSHTHTQTYTFTLQLLLFFHLNKACEMNRLFRTQFFNIAQKQHCLYDFDFREEQVIDDTNLIFEEITFLILFSNFRFCLD